jgi:hypothetical protein
LYNNLILSLSVYADGATDTWWYNRNGTGNVIFVPNTTISHPSDGDYNLIVYANNSYGNIGSASVTYNIDTNAPIITITYPTNGSVISGTVPIAVLIYGTASDVHLDSVIINDTTFGSNLGTPQAWDFSNANVTEGFHSVLITANDTLGNVKSAELHFNVTSTIPPAPTPKVPLVSGVLFSSILLAGGIISYLAMALETRDIRVIVGGLIFLLIILTLSAQMIIVI